MKVVVAILLCVVVVLGALLYRQDNAAKVMASQLAQIQAELKAATVAAARDSRGASLDAQAKCAEQAKREFQDLGYKVNATTSYENHFNSKLGKCFMHIHAMDASNPKTYSINDSVADAFEGKPYAAYSWQSVAGKKQWEVPPVDCYVIDPTGTSKRCNSNAEFNAFIRAYMTD